MGRLEELNRFYSLLSKLEKKVGGKRHLSQDDARLGLPDRGVYFFFEEGETRDNDTAGRVVRVGTHAVSVSKGSGTTLWSRLRAHRGTLSGSRKDGGNHRGSIFRLHVGTAILNLEGSKDDHPDWGKGSTSSSRIRDSEYRIEMRVSQHIRKMPFLWLEVDDEPSKQSKRAYLERNAIALLSNVQRPGTDRTIDPPSKDWLGRHCANPAVHESGLWNVRHVDSSWHPRFLDKLESYIESM